MKFSRTVMAAGISLGLLTPISEISAATLVNEFDIDLPIDPSDRVTQVVDIGGFGPGDPVALFNLSVPVGGGKLGSMTIYTRDPALDFFAAAYDYELTINGVLQDWDPASFDSYRYIFDVPLGGGTHEFFITLSALLPGQATAPIGTTAEFFFLAPGGPVPIPIPASGLLLFGAFVGLIRLQKRDKI